MNVKIIVPVAGKGKRFGSNIPKQFYDLAGKPVILYTIRNLITSPLINGGVIVCRENAKQKLQELLNSLPEFNDNYRIVIGGERRQDSVYNGFKNISSDTAYVLIHDGARPFVNHDMIERCVLGAIKVGACIAAIPVNDTIKKIKNGKIENTVDRSNLYRAQTPQVFRYDILKNAFEQNQTENLDYTDEAALVEKAGYDVHVENGDVKNIKITTRDDLLIAEKFAEQEKLI